MCSSDLDYLVALQFELNLIIVVGGAEIGGRSLAGLWSSAVHPAQSEEVFKVSARRLC